MFRTDVAEGVHLIQHANVNCWLIEDDEGLTLVDAGLPGTWRHLQDAVHTLGYQLDNITALVLTHAHFDHVGMARRLIRQTGLPVYAHSADHELAAHPFRYAHESPIVRYPLRYPKALTVLGPMLLAGVPFIRGIDGVRSLAVGEELEVPGSPHGDRHPGPYLWTCGPAPAGPGRGDQWRCPGHPRPLHRPDRAPGGGGSRHR